MLWTFVNFAEPESFKKRMAKGISQFNSELEQEGVKVFLDPFAFAANWHHTFLGIHPFLDGNSLLSRLLLNTVLLKLLGVVIPIGRDSVEAGKWKETTCRAFEIVLLGEEYLGEKFAWAEMNTLVVIQGRETLRALKDCLVGGKMVGILGRRKSDLEYETEEADVN